MAEKETLVATQIVAVESGTPQVVIQEHNGKLKRVRLSIEVESLDANEAKLDWFLKEQSLLDGRIKKYLCLSVLLLMVSLQVAFSLPILVPVSIYVAIAIFFVSELGTCHSIFLIPKFGYAAIMAIFFFTAIILSYLLPCLKPDEMSAESSIVLQLGVGLLYSVLISVTLCCHVRRRRSPPMGKTALQRSLA